MLRRPDPPEWRVEPATLGVTTIEFSTWAPWLYCCCCEFNIICGESPCHSRSCYTIS